MVAITLPAAAIPQITIPRGILLNVDLLGVRVTIPPEDIPLTPSITLWQPITLFDTDWIVKPLLAAINNVLPGFWEQLQAWFEQVPQTIMDALTTVVDSIRTALLQLPETITNMISQATGWITGKLLALWDGLQALGSQLKTWLTEGWSNLINTITKGLEDFKQWFTQNIITPIAQIPGQVVKSLEDLRQWFTQGWTQLSQAMGENLYKFTKWIADVGYEIGDHITQGLKGLGDWILGGLKGAWDWFNTTVIKPAAAGLEQICTTIIDTIKSALETLWNALMQIIPRKPEDSLQAAVALSGVTVAALAAPQLVALTADAVHPFKTLQLRDTLSDLAQALGLKNVIPFITGALVAAGFQLPFQHYINSIFRPALPSLSQADMMYLQGNITKEEWAQIYRYHGWKDNHISAWFNTMFIQPSDLILARMYEIPGVPKSWILQKYKERGYKPEDAEIMLMMARRYAVSDEIKALRSALISAAADGIISDRDVMAYLSQIGVSDEELSIILQILDVKWKMSLSKSLMQEAITDYQAGYLDDQALMDRLIQIGYRPEKAQAIVNIQRLKREKELKRSRAKTLVQAFRSGLITEDELYAGLIDAGMIKEVAAQVVAYESIKALKKAK
ncbi:MAG: hypothetical protein QXF79_01810 [Ignisphaera sp.]